MRLDENEKELFRVREAVRSQFFGPLIAIMGAFFITLLNIWWGNLFAWIATITVIVCTIGWVGYLFLPWYLSYLLVTNRNVRERQFMWNIRRIIGKQDIPLNQISARRSESNLLQVLLRVSDIIVDSSAAGNIMIKSVARPDEVLRQINEAAMGTYEPKEMKKPEDWLSAPQIIELVRSEVAAAVAYHLRDMQNRPVEERLQMLWKTFQEGGLTEEEYLRLKKTIIGEPPEETPLPSEPESPTTN